jgi:hypothetical protein
MIFQYIILGIYYLIGISFFIFKDYKYAKKYSFDNQNQSYISLTNENRILDRLIDNQIEEL